MTNTPALVRCDSGGYKMKRISGAVLDRHLKKLFFEIYNHKEGKMHKYAHARTYVCAYMCVHA